MVDAVAQRVVPSRALIFVYFPLLVYLVGLRQWYAAARSTALEQLVQARADILVASGALTAALASTVNNARGMSSGSRAAADEMVAQAIQSSDAGASSQAARAVRDAARSSVRTSSRRLWIDSATVRESMPWRDIFAVSLRTHPLPMAAAALLERKPKPTDADIEEAMTNLCRCGTYQRVRAAIHRAAGAQA